MFRNVKTPVADLGLDRGQGRLRGGYEGKVSGVARAGVHTPHGSRSQLARPMTHDRSNTPNYRPSEGPRVLQHDGLVLAKDPAPLEGRH